MYDHLVGEVTEKAGSRAVLRTGGVGYELKVSLTTASQLQVGGQATLYTILNVVDGTPSLLGFASRTERELARRLLSTSGVGPSIVLSILSVYSPREVAGVIQSSDVQALKRVKGVGQKTAERLCLELRDVVGKLDLGDGGTADTAKQATVDQEAEDAVLALVTLGSSEKEARSKLEKVVERAPGLKTEELVRAVLQS